MLESPLTAYLLELRQESTLEALQAYCLTLDLLVSDAIASLRNFCMRQPSLPYVTAPGNIDKALRGIQHCDVPGRINTAFVSEVLDIRGSSARQIVLWLKRTGFVNADESPTGLYVRFRDKATAASAAGDALRTGYAALYARNPMMHTLPDADIGELIMKSTGLGLGSNVVTLMIAAINGLRAHAGIDRPERAMAGSVHAPHQVSAGAGPMRSPDTGGRGMIQAHANSPAIALKGPSSQMWSKVQGSSAFTIYLALPETSDSVVLSAIFKAMKDNLLGG
jgi:hypothetical protein